MVNYSIVKHNAATITGQATNVAEAVANVNRAQGDPWSSEGKLFVAVFVGNDATGAYPMVENGGVWWAPDVEAFAQPHTFGTLAHGALFTLPGGRKVWRKADDANGQAVGVNAVRRGFRRSDVVVPAN